MSCGPRIGFVPYFTIRLVPMSSVDILGKPPYAVVVSLVDVMSQSRLCSCSFCLAPPLISLSCCVAPYFPLFFVGPMLVSVVDVLGGPLSLWPCLLCTSWCRAPCFVATVTHCCIAPPLNLLSAPTYLLDLDRCACTSLGHRRTPDGKKRSPS